MSWNHRWSIGATTMALAFAFVVGATVRCTATDPAVRKAPNGTRLRSSIVYPGGPLKVVFHSPTGEAGMVTTIDVVFNKPMVKLGRNGREIPIHITPPLAGKQRWVSGDTLKLELDDDLRVATIYQVRLPASITALNGTPLERDVTWTFKTPRPRAESIKLSARLRWHKNLLEKGDHVELWFNHPMKPESVRPFLDVKVDGKAADFKATVDGQDNKRVIVRPLRPLHRGATLEVHLRPGYRGAQGTRTGLHPIGLTKGKRPAPKLTVTCNGRPVKGASFSCWPTSDPDLSGLKLTFSTPVRTDELLKRLRIQPAPSEEARNLYLPNHECSTWQTGETQNCTRQLVTHLHLKPRTRYTVRIAKGLRDIYGADLGAARTFTFRTRDLPPAVRLAPFERGYHNRRENGAEYLLRPREQVKLKAINVPRVTVRTTTLAGPGLIRFLECKFQRSSAKSPRRGGVGKGWIRRCLNDSKLAATVRKQVIHTAGKRNVTVARHLQLRSTTRPPGILAVEATSSSVRDVRGRQIHQTRLINFTSINVHSRLTPYNLIVWATTLEDGKPIPGARVQVYDAKARRLHGGRTDAQGIYQGPGFGNVGDAAKTRRAPRLYVLVRSGKDVAYSVPGSFKPSAWNIAPVVVPRTRDGGAKPWEGFVTYKPYLATERDIYRRGQRVNVYGIVRKHTNSQIRPLAGRTVQLRIRSSTGTELGAWRVKLSAYGGFTSSYDLPSTAPLGSYYLFMDLGAQRIASHRFELRQYRAPRFEVSLKFAQKKIIRGRPQLLKLRGSFFSGGRTAGAFYRWVALRTKGNWGINLPPNYGAGSTDHRSQNGGRHITQKGKASLDPGGRAQLRIATGPKHIWHPVRYVVEAEIRDRTQSTVAKSAELAVYPARYVPAVKQLSSRWSRPYKGWNLHRFRVLAVDRKGNKQTGRKVSVAVYPLVRRYVASRWHDHPNEPDSYSKLGNNINWKKPLLTKTLRSTAGGASFTFAHLGDHPRLAVVFWTTDPKGRTARTDLRVVKPKKPPKPKKAAPKPHPRRAKTVPPLTVTLDKRRYRPGQVAIVSIRAQKQQASAMVFVERERIFKAIPVRLTGGRRARVRIKVTDAHLGNVMVRVVTYPIGKARVFGDPVPPLTEQVTLRVDTDVSALKVGLRTDRKTYRPGQKVKITLDVRDFRRRGRQAEVVLMAVDEAVLRLTNFKLPNPYSRLFHIPAADVSVEDLRYHLMPIEGPWHLKWSRIGKYRSRSPRVFMSRANVRGAQPMARSRFRTTPLFKRVRTNARGRSTVTFRLPDNLTAYRVMAVAYDKTHRAGIGQTVIKVDKPITAIPAVPRFMRVGDTAWGGVAIYNKTRRTSVARVSLKASGLTVKGALNRRVTVAGGSVKTVRFQLTARRPGTAHLTFGVRVGRKTDAVIRTFPVTTPTVVEVRSLAGSTTRKATQRVDTLTGVRRDIGGLTVSLSPSALTGMQEGMAQLIEYPYGCFEQKASKLLPLFAAIGLGKRFGIGLPRNPKAMARKSLAELLGMQRNDGGFSYWPQYRKSNPWLATYALVILHRAQQVGLAVAKPNVSRIAAYLGQHLKTATGPRTDAGLSATIVYALSLHRYRVTQWIRPLYAKRALLGAEAKALLLAAVGLQRKVGVARRKVPEVSHRRPPSHPRVSLATMAQTLTKGVTSHLTVDSDYAFVRAASASPFGSADRTTAMVLLALLRAAPSHPMVERLTKYLAGGRKAQGRSAARFGNTQEAAWSLMALLDYARIRERAIPRFTATVQLGAKQLLSARFAGRQLISRNHVIPMTKLLGAVGSQSRALIFSKQGRGKLYYTARLRYAARKMHRMGVARGFIVRRTLQKANLIGRHKPHGKLLRMGDVVRVTLTVTNRQTRRFVAIDDPLPAGFEAVDPTLATSGWLLRSAVPVRRHQWRSSHYSHRELRDDRVLHFVDRLSPGTHTYSYLARVATLGRFTWPSTRVEEMYSPGIYGLSGGRVLQIRR